MKILLSWINDFVEISDIPVLDLSKKLTDSGFEVEEIINKAKGLERVVACQIKSIKQHPNADKLVVCQVDKGDEITQIVTGATNMKEGDKVPLALDGADLPCGIKIKNGQIRGEASNGMFCGGDEIGINNSIYEGAETYGLLILKDDVIVGENMAKVLGLDEIILDVNVLPNRPDCNSILGIAREISALLKRPLKNIDLSYNSSNSTKNINVKIKDFKMCPHYMGVVVEDVKNGTSPSWMQKRLSLMGHNPHNLFVDITNYILLETGQPMHAFDLSKINGDICVRPANNGEKIVALDEKEYELNSNNLVICDDQKPLVIAGIMGGIESGTYPQTQSVFLESALFHYATIRRTSHTLGLSSDSCIRFSKGVYFDSQEFALKRALNLIDRLNVGKISNMIVDVYDEKIEEKVVSSSVANINQRLALDITGEEMKDILNSLSIKTTLNDGVLTSIIPVFRSDIERECDICEEVGRIYGLNNIDLSNLSKTNFLSVGKLTTEQTNLNNIKLSSAFEGFNEMISWQFISPKLLTNLGENPEEYIKVKNPIGLDYSIMRKSLTPAVLNAISFNQKQGNKNLYLFEQARVFHPKELPLKSLPDEKEYLCLCINAEGENFYTLKNSLNKIMESLNVKLSYKNGNTAFLHPGVQADVHLYNRKVGFIGQLHPTVSEKFEISKKTFICEIDLTNVIKSDRSARVGNQPPKFPNVERDIALLVEKELPVENLLMTALKEAKEEICDAKVFDVYESCELGNKKSVAIKLFIKQSDKTLNESEISAVVKKVLTAEEEKHGAKLR